ncbi:MAG: O-antigen ligase family protein [Calditrichota bacterium]
MSRKKTAPSVAIQRIFIAGILITFLLYSRKTIDPVLPVRLLYLSAFLSLFLLLLWRRDNKSTSTLFNTPLLYTALAGVLLQALSTLWAVNVSEALIQTLKSGLFLILALITVQVIRSGKDRRLLAHSLAVLTILLSFIGICQYYQLGFTEIPGHFIIYGTMVNKNLFASVLVLILPYLLYAAIVHRGSGSILAMAGVIAGSVAIGHAHSRAAWLALIILLILSGFLFIRTLNNTDSEKKIREILRKRLVLVLVICGLATGLSALLNFFSIAAPKHITSAASTSVTATRSLGERQQLWQKTLGMIVDHPIVGVGAENWKVAFPRYSEGNMRSADGSVQFMRPHNDFLWIAGESGVVGLLLYIALLGLAILSAWRAILNSSTPQERFFAGFLLAFFAAHIVISNFSFPKERVAHSILFWISVGLTLQYPPSRGKSLKLHPQKLLLPITLLITLGATFVYYSRLQSETALKQSFTANKAQNWTSSLRFAKDAASSIYTIDPSATSPAFFEGQAYIKLNKMPEAAEALERAYKHNPNHILTLGNLAAAKHRLDDLSAAERLFKEALLISPGLESLLINLSAVYFKQGRVKEALAELDKCDPSSTNPRIEQYRQIYRQQAGGSSK